MFQVYRIEHAETGVGPFQTNDVFTQQLAAQAAQNQNLRCPGDDGLPLGQIPFSYVFGCLDIATLKRWFFQGDTTEANDVILQSLRARGFRLAEYLVESQHCRVSATGIQVAFDSYESRDEGLVQYHDMNTLLSKGRSNFCTY